MNSALDRIKSTITISLGTKNRLRVLKGSESYEEFINYLIRLRDQTTHKTDNFLEIQKFIRKKGIYSFEGFKIIFSYNQYNGSQNFIFDISIDKIRENGKIVPFSKYIKELSHITKKDFTEIEYRAYFQLLQIAVQKEIDSLFKHKGRFEDYFSWEQEFKMLNLPEKSFEEDVMDKLNNFRQGQGAF